MKLRKLILPAILALGAVGGFAAAKLSNRGFAQTRAMDGYTGDYSVDVGLNVQRSQYQSGTWEICQFFVNSFESADVSQGDYFAIRINVAEGAGSYFDFIPNVGGNANRITISPVASGIKCVPAVPDGVAFNYAGARDFDLPMNLWSGANIWFCIPKAELTRTYFGSGTINWSEDTLWAAYFMFYGVTQDNVNFDIGDIWMANIDGDGHLQKVNRILNWANINGTATTDTGDGSMAKLALARNNVTLQPAAKFIQAIENVDACDSTAAGTAYDNNIVAYTQLNSSCKAYLEEAYLGDYADGDTAHAGGRLTRYTAAAKWAAICEAAGHGSSSRVVLFNNQNKAWLFVVIASVSALSLAGVFFIIRRKRVTSK